MALMMRLINRLIDYIYPSSIYCISCGNIIDESRNYSLCNDCFRKFKWINERTCINCGKILSESNNGTLCYDCQYNKHEFDGGFACVQYGSVEKQLIFKLKYAKRTYIARVIAEIMYDRMLIEDIDYDIVIPVPIHRSKNRSRGFNQAELIAKYFCKNSNKIYYKNIANRISNTIPLKTMDPAERKLNLINAFNLTEKGKSLVNGKKILIIDDIYTTGATIDSLSEKLRAAGVNKIYFLVFAIGGDLIRE